MLIAQAPVRVSFGGGGTDLAAYYEPYGGLVVSAAISSYCYALARPARHGQITLTSLDYGVSESVAPGAPLALESQLALPRAALAAFWERGALGQGGFELLLWADVPPGTGLGSSSAMAVALVHALAAFAGRPLDPAEAAGLACEVELERLGMPIGRQDQYASAFGGLNTIYFADDGVRVRPLDLPPGLAEALCARTLLFTTNRQRHSASVLRQQQRDSAADARVIQHLHQIKALALEMRAALQAGDLDGFGDLLDRTWHEKRALSARVSSGAIDRYYALARQAGARGGKITGAGGGGFLLLYCPPEQQNTLRATLHAEGLRELPFTFAPGGAAVCYEQAGGLLERMVEH